MVLNLLWFLCLSAPEASISSDGSNLTIVGEGIVTQAIARSKGNYQEIRFVNVTEANELSDNCFLEFSMLENIFLPEKFQSIGASCFMRCFKLKSLVIPEGVTKLKASTFYRCNDLEEVTFPSTLQDIYYGNVFYECHKLKKYYVHGDNSYFSTDSTNSYLMSLNKTILYKGPSDADQVIPKTVKRILTYYSRACKLKSISFEGGCLEDIDSSGFVSESVEVLKLPNTMKYIRSSFFSGTIGTLIIPDSVISFHNNALAGISNLGDLQIGSNSKVLYKDSEGIIFDKAKTVLFFVPKTASKIELANTIESVSQTTVKSHNIMSIEVVGNPNKYSSFYGVLYESNGLSLYACPGGMKNVKIVGNCTTIMTESFMGNLVETVEMSDTIKHIKSQAFSGCSNLESFNIPSNLEQIDGYAFAHCIKLSISGKFPKNFKLLSESSFGNCNLRGIDFSQCSQLKTIPTYCFQLCKFTEIVLPPNLQTVSKQAFEDCQNLQAITFPSSLTGLAESSFMGCISLANVAFESCGNAEGKLKEIQQSAFEQSGITSIVIPNCVETISAGAFAKCERLESISFEGGSKLRAVRYGILKGCGALERFEVPSEVSDIEAGAFVGASGLLNFVVAEGNTVFEDLSGVLFLKSEKVLHSFPGGRDTGKVGESVTGIFKMAFQDCVKLRNLTFAGQSQIRTIGEFTFSGCSGLGTIALPGSIEEIAASGFSGCSSLANVTFGVGSKLSVLSKSVFADCGQLERVVFAGESELTSIGEEALRNCRSLLRFDIQGKVRSIGTSAFEGCESLRDIRLPMVETVGERAFFGCSALDDIIISESMQRLGALCFGNCSSLGRVYICNPDGLDMSADSFKSIKEGAVILIPVGSEVGAISGIIPTRILDFECHIPTWMFTQDDLHVSVRVFTESVSILSASLCDE